MVLENKFNFSISQKRFWLKSKNEDINKPLEEIILHDIPDEWKSYNAVICEPIHLGTKFMKIVKKKNFLEILHLI